MMTSDDEDDDEYSVELHWEGPGDLHVVFDETFNGKYQGDLYLAANWSSDSGKIIGWQPVYRTPTSRADEVEKNASFAWDGEGGVFHFDGRDIVLRRDEPAKEAA